MLTLSLLLIFGIIFTVIYCVGGLLFMVLERIFPLILVDVVLFICAPKIAFAGLFLILAIVIVGKMSY